MAASLGATTPLSGQQESPAADRAPQEGSASAQATPVPHPPKPRTEAYVRTWIMLPADEPTAMVGEAPDLKDRLRIEYSQGSGSPQVLVNRATPFQLRSYTEIPPGRYTFRMVRDRDGDPEEIASADVTLKAGSFVTLIAYPKDGRIVFTLADDTKSARQAPEREGAQPPPPPPKEIVFYNFVPATTVRVRSEEPAFERTLHYGAVERISPLPAKLLNIQTIQTVNDREQIITTEVDLPIYDSLSFVIVQDIYGRSVPGTVPNAVVD